VSVPLVRIIALFTVLFLVGTGLTLPLYGFHVRRFVCSRLFIKILFWIPICVMFICILYMPAYLQSLCLILLLALAGREILAMSGRHGHRALAFPYWLIFAAGLGHLALLHHQYTTTFTAILITLAFATVLADVGAFFFGNYAGRHKLPPSLNDKKSWEGVLGEVVGAFIGVLLVNTFVLPVASVWMFVALGAGSALGDLTNSYVKRKLALDEWGRAIPGHGGILDRFSSMAGSAVLVFYFLLIVQP
jgi:CDP-diglyceride synthetase